MSGLISEPEQEERFFELIDQQIEWAADLKDFETVKDLCSEGIELAKEQRHPETVNHWNEKFFQVAKVEKDGVRHAGMGRNVILQ